MKTVFHAANSRGIANHGWLNSRHTFSFAEYYDPDRIHFGVLRVLNDDQVAGGQGFGAHPHRDMEIISIPLEGSLAHRDSMGSSGVIQSGDVQVMSAGTGVTHSEMNADPNQPVKFLQIWVLPRENGVEPRYQQMTLPAAPEHGLRQILSPHADDDGLWIHQDAWFSLANIAAGKNLDYQIKRPENGVYVFVLKGTVALNGFELQARDGIGVWDTTSIELSASENAEVLLMDIPMDVASHTNR